MLYRISHAPLTKLLKEVTSIEPLLIYEQYEHRITSFLNELEEI